MTARRLRSQDAGDDALEQSSHSDRGRVDRPRQPQESSNRTAAFEGVESDQPHFSVAGLGLQNHVSQSSSQLSVEGHCMARRPSRAELNQQMSSNRSVYSEETKNAAYPLLLELELGEFPEQQTRDWDTASNGKSSGKDGKADARQDEKRAADPDAKGIAKMEREEYQVAHETAESAGVAKDRTVLDKSSSRSLASSDPSWYHQVPAKSDDNEKPTRVGSQASTGHRIEPFEISSTSAAPPPNLRRARNLVQQSTPGAVSVPGRQTETFADETVGNDTEVSSLSVPLTGVVRISSITHWLTARAVEEESPSELVEASPLQPSSSKTYIKALLKNRKVRLLVLLVTLLVIGLVVGIVLSTWKGKSGSNSTAISSGTMAPMTDAEIIALNSTIRALLSEESLKSLDSDPDSPQARSLQWLLENSNFRELTKARQIQRFGMVVFYYSTFGEGWENADNWLSDEHECEWFDFSYFYNETQCDNNGSLVALDLRENKLGGRLPDELRLLTSLQSIDVMTNRISGSIPSAIESLTELDFLDLAENDFTGGIPSFIDRLTLLSFLNLSGNTKLGGTLPNELFDAVSLTTLSLEICGLTGTLPSAIEKLTNLIEMGLSENLLDGTIPIELSMLTHLELFHVYHNNIGGTIPSQLGQLTNLMTGFFESNAFTGAVPTEIGFLSKLLSFDVGENNFTGFIPSEIGKCSFLEFLSFADNQSMTGPIPSEFTSLVDLSFLFLSGTALTGTIPEELCELEQTSEGPFELNFNIDCNSLICSCCQNELGAPCSI